MRTPKPKPSIASGISATEGTGRSTSIVTEPSRAARRDSPSTSPSAMPSTAPSSRPSAAVPSVKPVACHSEPSSAAPAKALAAALGGASASLPSAAARRAYHSKAPISSAGNTQGPQPAHEPVLSHGRAR